MNIVKVLLVIILIGQLVCLPTFARPGEAVDDVLKRYSLEGQKSVTQEDYVSYKVNDGKFVAKPTVFFKLGANGIVLEENFLFDKNRINVAISRAQCMAIVVYSPILLETAVGNPKQMEMVGMFCQLIDNFII